MFVYDRPSVHRNDGFCVWSSERRRYATAAKGRKVRIPDIPPLQRKRPDARARHIFCSPHRWCSSEGSPNAHSGLPNHERGGLLCPAHHQFATSEILRLQRMTVKQARPQHLNRSANGRFGPEASVQPSTRSLDTSDFKPDQIVGEFRSNPTTGGIIGGLFLWPHFLYTLNQRDKDAITVPSAHQFL